MAAPPAVKVMSLLEILHGICDMEEMKKSSPATKDVVERTQDMAAILEGEENCSTADHYSYIFGRCRM